MSDLFKDGLFKLASMYVSEFEKQPEETLMKLCRLSAPLKVMTTVYGFLVFNNEIIKIEDMDTGIKEKLWAQAKATCPNATIDHTIRLTKAIWLINSILEK